MSNKIVLFIDNKKDEHMQGVHFVNSVIVNVLMNKLVFFCKILLAYTK
jgi:hypothetical protein